jgi:hypothetical protein
MEVFILIAIIALLVLAIKASGNRKSTASPQQTRSSQKQTASQYPSKKQFTNSLRMSDEEKKAAEARELAETLLKSIKITVGPSKASLDDSIIDVTNNRYKIPDGASSNASDVPYWPHFYVYSYQDLNKTNAQQKAFYQHFKACFLKGEYLDIKGNTNYAFILLFDLLQEFDRQPDLNTLEEQLGALGDNYVRTASYCRSFLIEKMQKRGDYEGIERVNENYRYRYPSNGYDYAEYNLGSKYKNKLKLTEEQVQLVNKIYYPNNNFCSIEFCLLQTIKLYVLTIEEFKQKFADENSSLTKELESIAGHVATKEYKYRQNSSNFKYAVESLSADLYRLLFKYAENALREHYGHKRKISTDFQFGGESKKQLQEKIIDRMPDVLTTVLPKIDLPDEAAELALNEQNTSRWKSAFDEIKAKSAYDSEAFFQAIHQLAKANKRNPSIENIFLEASKAIAKTDRAVSLTLYVYYLYYDLKSATFDNRPLTKTIQKSLFKTAEELQAFEQLVTNLIKERDLEKALADIPKVFGPKRKKIKLDAAAITEVHQKHSSTVNLLDEILSDEEEGERAGSVETVKPENELIIEIVQNSDTSTQPSTISNPHNLSLVQLELLEVFGKQSLLISSDEMEAFAKSKGLFKNGLVESLNEACYEYLDDVLIEEEDDNYVINEQYFQKITAV